ncbi:MAG: acyl-CoA dehydrogenase [Gammaproteobacteria bacterium]|nr:acyl-CoA dehydrogenase [Gammaproteobacteria bacterium]
MNIVTLNQRDIDFLLYEFLDTESLLKRKRYAEHSKETFDATIAGAKKIAETYYANHYQKGDGNEPKFDGKSVTLIPEIQDAWNATADFGLLSASYDFDEGGVQLPEVICKVCGTYIQAANSGSSGYYFVTAAASSVIRAFGSEQQKALFLHPMMDGRCAGTMALTEPDQGSTLSDIKTSAVLQADQSYRIRGQKIYISNGDHTLSENIVHLVLARIDGAPKGTRGISLFIVPKFLVNTDGTIGEANDVVLAGLLHKMGNRSATSTVLNFGEKNGAVGYLLGKPHQGLRYMFQMMNDLRIGVGLGASAIAYRGYLHALEYARERPQGRLPSNKDPMSPQVKIIEHADVRRMLLMQKSYAEGSLALCLYAASLAEDSKTASSVIERNQASALLDFLTPLVKTFPSKYGCISNDLAIQVLGGSGYIREYPAEQLYRDQRLNPIHEGTEGIHGLDLLGRKVSFNNGESYELFISQVEQTLADAADISQISHLVPSIREAINRTHRVTESLLFTIKEDPDLGLANATIYLDMFGQVVISWIWLKQAVIAARKLSTYRSENSVNEYNFYQGKIYAAQYFINRELPQTIQKAELLGVNESTCYEMCDEYF